MMLLSNLKEEKNKKKAIVLLTIDKDYFYNEKVYDYLKGKQTKSDPVFLIVEGRSLFRVIFSKDLNNKISPRKDVYLLLNPIPFQRFSLIYQLNISIIKLLLSFIAKVFQKKNKDLVIFLDRNMYKSLPKSGHELYLICPDLKPLISHRQIELLEYIRILAIQSTKVFAKNRQAAEEMKIFNKNVIQLHK